MRRRIPATLAFLLLLASASLAFAQRAQDKEDSNTRSVQGVVMDEARNPVARAVVQLKDLRTLQIRSFFTSEEGEFRFSGLSKDTDYELKATFKDQSSESKRLTVFDNRQTARINLTLEKK